MRPTSPSILVLASSLLLAACGTADAADEADVRAERGLPLWGATADKSVARCGGGEYVRGIDVSKWQGAIDWTKVADAGIAYAFIRTSYGLTGVDPYFDANWAAARDAGVLRGTYHYFNPAYSGADQARNMLAQFDDAGDLGELPLVVDVEESSGAPSPATYASRVLDFVDTIEAETGRRPMIYTGGYFWDTYVGSAALADLPVWVAHYFNDRTTAHCPNTPNAWAAWTFWQYSEMGVVSGVSGGVDSNVFDGSYEQLLALTFRRATVVSQSFPARDEAPLLLRQGECQELSLTVQNTGGVAWDGDVQLALSGPRDGALPAVASPAWPSTTRVAGVDANVALGAEHTFRFELCGNALGVHTVDLALVHTGVTWFSDAGQGGPADDALRFDVEVVPAAALPDAGPPTEPGPDAGVVLGGSDAGVTSGPGDAGVFGGPGPARGHMDCSVATVGGAGAAAPPALVCALALLLLLGGTRARSRGRRLVLSRSSRLAAPE
ncbi:MAG: glycoside hydrolase family 25 protein [Sandaracinaceae bacterium]|nr:glycoside hydrolase family 25 protein [Sandaracinaceae bacterium]